MPDFRTSSLLACFLIVEKQGSKRQNIFIAFILASYTVMIRLSGHVCSRFIFPDKLVFRITESHINADGETGSYTFCPD